MNSREHSGAGKGTLLLAFLSGSIFGMLAMGVLTANFSDAYNPGRKKKHPRREPAAPPRQHAVGESPQM